MIVFLNIKSGCLDIYTNTGRRQCLFSDIEAIKQIIGNEKAVYITGAQEATRDEIIEVVKSVSSNIVTEAIQKEEKTYIRTTSRGYVLIAELDIEFKGPADCVLLDKLFEKHGKNMFQEYPILKNMLKNGQLQIVTESQTAKIKKEHFKELNVKQSRQDQALDNILVDDKVDNYIETYGEDGGAGHDAIEINVTAGPAGSKNEGSLLPDDF